MKIKKPYWIYFFVLDKFGKIVYLEKRNKKTIDDFSSLFYTNFSLSDHYHICCDYPHNLDLDETYQLNGKSQMILCDKDVFLKGHISLRNEKLLNLYLKLIHTHNILNTSQEINNKFHPMYTKLMGQ